MESVGSGNAFNASPQPPTLKIGSNGTEPGGKGLGSFVHPGANSDEKESRNRISELSRESITTLGQSRETNTGISPSIKVVKCQCLVLIIVLKLMAVWHAYFIIGCWSNCSGS